MRSILGSAGALFIATAVSVVSLLPATAAQASAPHPCILTPSDVPSGYEIDTAYHETTNDAILSRSENPNLAGVIERTGRVTGFEVVYAQPTLDALLNGPLAIQSWVTIFDNAEGAQAVLNASARGDILSAPEMGEESIAWKTPPRPGLGGVSSVVIGYAFRRSSDQFGWTELAGISVGAVDGVTSIETVADLVAILRARGCT